MVTGFLRAFGQLGDPRIVRILGAVLVVSALVFLAVLGGAAWVLTHERLTHYFALEAVLKTLGGVATLAIALFLFPSVISAILGCWLDAVARAVEAQHYPDLPPAKGLGLVAGLAATLRFVLKALLVNAVLVLFLFVPLLFPFAWFAANSYLLGREYFEFAAMRRLPADAARLLR